MVICSSRSVCAYRYYYFVDENEWHRRRNALEFLDLGDDYKNFFDCYKKKLLSPNNPFFQSLWIIVSSRKHKYPFDGCRVHLEWSSDKTDSIYFHTSIKNRNPDWIGRNIFLEYLRKKLDLPHSILAESDLRWLYTYRGVLNQLPTSLDLGESTVHFFQLATLCGFDTWKKTFMGNRINASDRIFKIIYPSILRWLYQNREDYLILTAKLLDMFCDTSFSIKWLFTNVPDKQHLEFLLGFANRTHFNIFKRQFRRFRGHLKLELTTIIERLMLQRRFELITVLLLHGFTMNESPSSLISVIVKQIRPIRSMEPEFHTLKEFLEMFRKLIISLPLKFPCNEPSLTMLLAKNPNLERDIVEEMVYAYENSDSGIKVGDVYKLKHVCRSFVRQRLGDNFLLPTGIYALDIPKGLKEYLNLDSPIPGCEEVLF